MKKAVALALRSSVLLFRVYVVLKRCIDTEIVIVSIKIF